MVQLHRLLTEGSRRYKFDNPFVDIEPLKIDKPLINPLSPRPLFHFDKLPEEVAEFSTLVAESAKTGVDWDIAFISAIAGRGSFAPNSDEATQPLKMMTEKIQGGMIADFLTFNKDGELVALY